MVNSVQQGSSKPSRPWAAPGPSRGPASVSPGTLAVSLPIPGRLPYRVL